MVAAFLPLIASLPLVSGSPELPPAALMVGVGAATGTFLSGHKSRSRAVGFALLGGLLADGAAWGLLG